MYHLLEIIILLYILYCSGKILSNPIYRNLATVLCFLAAAAGSSLVLWGSGKIIPFMSDNMVLQIIICLTMTTLAYVSTLVLFKKVGVPWIEEKIKTMTYFTSLPRFLAKSVNILFVFCLLVTMFVIVDFLAHLASLTPHYNHMISNSYFVKAISTHLPEEKAISADQETEKEAIFNAMEKQRRLFDTLQQGFRRTRTFLAEKTGTNVILEHIQFVKELSQLSEEEKLWLIYTTPALQNLVTHPSLKAIMTDERLLELILDASQASFAALYQLGEEPKIKHLFHDEALVDTIKQIRLKELLTRVKTRQNIFISTKILQ